MLISKDVVKQEQIVLERSARLNLDPGRGDEGDGGDSCKSAPTDDHLQEAGPSG